MTVDQLKSVLKERGGLITEDLLQSENSGRKRNYGKEERTGRKSDRREKRK